MSTANGVVPQIEYTNVESGTIKGVGNVTNLQTWTDTTRSPTLIYGVGQGVITTADGQDMATWIGYGVGRTNINGTITYHDIILFNTNSTGKLALKTLKEYMYQKLTVISELQRYMSGNLNQNRLTYTAVLEWSFDYTSFCYYLDSMNR